MDVNEELPITAKGKRTKRIRPYSPRAVSGTAITSSSSSAAGDSSDQEEEDMANCLILLALGRGGSEARGEVGPHRENKGEEVEIENRVGNRVGDNKMMVMTMTEKTKFGYDVYECKTCNRTFPSFQALGGHRASHKKSPPPAPPLDITGTSSRDFEEQTRQNHVNNFTVPPPQHRVSHELGVSHGNKSSSSSSKSKIHECSICSSEFTSGQALGGHMRRHRAVQAASSTNNNNNIAAVQTTRGGEDLKPRRILELDLNLPAPEDEFQVPANQKSRVVSGAPGFVGCHY